MNWPTIDRTIPKLRTWHLLGIIAATAGFIAVFQFRWTTQDEGYATIRRLRSMDAVERTKAVGDLYALRPRERRAVAPLTEMLFDNDPGARAAAARALVYLLSPELNVPVDDAIIAPVKAALASVLNDPDPSARFEIACSLGRLEADPQVIVPPLLEFARDPQASRRAEAVAVLGAYGRPSEPALAAIFDALGDPDSVVRLRAAEALTYCVLYPKPAPQPLRERIKATLLARADVENLQVRSGAITALCRIDGQLGIQDPQMVKFLSDPDRNIRIGVCMYVAWGRSRTRAPEFVPALQKALNDPEIRVSAAYALGHIGFPAEGALPALRNVFEATTGDERESVARSIAAIETAVQTFRTQTLPQDIADLGHPDDPITRALAAGRIEAHGPRAAAAIPSLVVCLSDREPEVRIAAATALGQLGPDATVTLPTLEKLVETDPDPRVRQAATRSRAILLRPPGPSNQAP